MAIIRWCGVLIGVLVAIPAIADDAVIDFKCFNPQLTINVPMHDSNSKGEGLATTDRVQFNINKASTGSEIFVNANNNGICKAYFKSSHRPTGGKYRFAEEGTWPAGIDKIVRVSSEVTSNKEIVFTVSRTADKPEGNVTITFFIEYEKVQ